MHHEDSLMPARAQEAEAGCPPQASRERRLPMSSAEAVRRLDAFPADLNERDELEGRKNGVRAIKQSWGESKPAKSSLSEGQGFTLPPGL